MDPKMRRRGLCLGYGQGGCFVLIRTEWAPVVPAHPPVALRLPLVFDAIYRPQVPQSEWGKRDG